jgi:WD40-like Beta Propeller Repeat
MARPVIRLGFVGMLCGLSWVVASRPSNAGVVQGGVAPVTCAPGVAAPAVCDRALGVALTLPKDWSVVPPGTLDFWTVVPGRDEAMLHLSITPLASTTACSDAQAVVAVAIATSRIPHYPEPITDTPMIVAGAPAIALSGLPGEPDFGQEIVLAHGGLLYGIYTFDDSRTALTPAQRQALASLRFISRSGPFPARPNAALTSALHSCNTTQATATARQGRRPSANGPLLVLDQRGIASSQVQIMPQHDEILTVERGRITRVMARRLTTYTCCTGLAPSPRGGYVAFTQTNAYVRGRTIDTKGLWVATSTGQKTHRLLRPPTPTNPGAPLDITAVAWSPDRYRLAYAVNLYTDTPVAPVVLKNTGLWLTRYNRPQPRHVVALAPVGQTIPSLAAACEPTPFGLTINALSWASDARTVATSVECENPRAPAHIAQVVLAVDTTTGRAKIIVTGGRDAAFAPAAPRLAYLTGRADGRSPMTLWVADARGHHARKLVTVRSFISSPAWSPDSQSIAYLVGSPFVGNKVTAIQRVNVATGRSQVVLTDHQQGQPLLPAGGHFTRLAWMPAPASRASDTSILATARRPCGHPACASISTRPSARPGDGLIYG